MLSLRHRTIAATKPAYGTVVVYLVEGKDLPYLTDEARTQESQSCESILLTYLYPEGHSKSIPAKPIPETKNRSVPAGAKRQSCSVTVIAVCRAVA